MRVVALTGGIASGKSFVAARFEHLGATVIDGDDVYHQLLREGDLSARLREAFGDRFFFEDGSLDRRSLGVHVFADPAELARLNALTHPIIIRRILHDVALAGHRSDCPLVVVVAAILFEAGWDRHFDTIIVVSVSREKQIQRLRQRSHLSWDEATKRIDSQLSLGEKISRAHHVIPNSGTREETLVLVDELWHHFVGHGGHRKS